MNASRRIALYILFVTAVLFPAWSVAQSAPEQLIIGKWRHITLIRVLDGQTLAPQHFNGENVAEFRADGTWSGSGPNLRSAGTYRWLSPMQIEQTIVESNLAIQVGAVTIRQVRVDRERLNLISVQRREDMDKFMPPPKPGERRPNEVTVTTVFSRVPAE